MQGAQRFLVKPVSVNEMEIAIHQALEFAKLRRWQREAEEQLTRLVETAPVPYIITRKSDGEILYANSHLADVFGIPPEEIKGRSSTDFYYNAGERDEVIARLEKDGFVKDLEVQVRRADGSFKWMVFSLAETEIGGEEVVLGGFLDITRRKEMEEKLRIYREVFWHSVHQLMQRLVAWLDGDVREKRVVLDRGLDLPRNSKGSGRNETVDEDRNATPRGLETNAH